MVLEFLIFFGMGEIIIWSVFNAKCIALSIPTLQEISWWNIGFTLAKPTYTPSISSTEINPTRAYPVYKHYKKLNFILSWSSTPINPHYLNRTVTVANPTHPYVFVVAGIVHENPRIGSDGESEEVSGASDEKEDVISPVKLRVRQRRFSEVSLSLFLNGYFI